MDLRFPRNLSFFAQQGGSKAVLPVYTNTTPSIGIEPITGFNGNEGVLYMEYTDSSANSGNDSVILTISDGGATNRIFVQKRTSNGGRFRVLSGATGETNEIYDGFLSTFANGTQRIAVGYSATELRVWVNGILVCKIEGNYVQNTFSQVDTGQLTGGGFTFNGTPDEVRFYDKLLTDRQGCEITKGVSILSGVTFDATKDLYMFLGQSNSVGQGTGTQTYTNTSDMFLLDNTMSMGAYSDPFAAHAGSLVSALNDSGANQGVSSAGHFADTLAGLTGNDIAVCPANLSGTSFTGTTPTWDMNSSAYRTSGSKITGIMATAMGALTQIQIAKQHAAIKGFIWQQGEGDVDASLSEAAYETHLRSLILSAQCIVGTAIPWFNCSMPAASTWAPSQGAWDNIDTAQQDVANDSDSVHYVSGCDILGDPSDRVHYDSAGHATIGALIANEVYNTVY